MGVCEFVHAGKYLIKSRAAVKSPPVSNIIVTINSLFKLQRIWFDLLYYYHYKIIL